MVRWLEPGTEACEQARTAVAKLRMAGEAIHMTPQNAVEFWNVITRPAEVNGLGLTPAQADGELGKLEALFPLLPDKSSIHAEWRRLVVANGVIGVQAHDARLVACLRVHGVTHLLTFNSRHFKNYEGITAVHPSDLSGPSQL